MTAKNQQYLQAKEILKNKSSQYFNRRTEFLMEPWLNEINPAKEKVASFHSSWLMYMDGPEHKELRQKTLRAIRLSLSNDFQIQFPETQIYTDETLRDIVSQWHCNLMGITSLEQKQAYELASPILDFFFYSKLPQNDFSKLKQNICKLESWFKNTDFRPEGILYKLVRQDIPAGVCLNILIDSYEPVYCAFGTLLYLSAGQKFKRNLSTEQKVSELLRMYPPFRFINRIDTQTDPLKKISIDLLAANRCPHSYKNPEELSLENLQPNHLSYGYGKHACPGANISFQFLCASLKEFENVMSEKGVPLVGGKIDIERGFCRIIGFEIKWAL